MPETKTEKRLAKISDEQMARYREEEQADVEPDSDDDPEDDVPQGHVPEPDHREDMEDEED